MAHADIIIYGLIAVVLLARLWAVFGRRNEEDRQRPNPFATPAPGPARDNDVIVRPGNRTDDAQAPAFAAIPIAPMSLAGGLESIKRIDPAFEEKQFLQDARKIFTDVVGAFAKGDLSPVKNQLGPAILPHFQTAIDTRAKSGEALENKINRISDAEITAAAADEKNASITVRFITEQENILRDAAGTILSGAPGKPEEITDLWTFARDAKSGWTLAETKS